MPLNSPIPEKKTGRLYIVATPIGHLEDITIRALKVLARVDLIAAEDTRRTMQLLRTHDLKTPLVSYHEHNERQRTPELVSKLLRGAQLALVTDAGTPTVSDPGYRLVEAAVQSNIAVVPIPGPSAVIAALSAAGLPTDSFTFVGFPARKKHKRMAQLRSLADLPHAVVFYQSPRRIKAFLAELLTVLGNRRAVLARELTKMHEEFIRGPLEDISAKLDQRSQVKGECTLIVHGAESSKPTEVEIETAVEEAVTMENRPISDVAKSLARRLGIPRKEVYAKALEIQNRMYQESSKERHGHCILPDHRKRRS